MSIKQNGGVFGRNPTFNDVTIEGQLTFEGNIDIDSDITWEDGKKAIFGNNDDLQIYHDGNNSYIKDTGTGDLRIWADNPNISTASGNKIFYGNNGAAELYFTGGGKRLETTSTGVSIGGNLVIATSGKGIDFSATSGTGTSELLDDYEEGTWTPTITGSTSGSVAGITINRAAYTKIGNQVTVYFYISAVNLDTASLVGNAEIGGLPFVAANSFMQLSAVNYTNFFSFDESDISVGSYVHSGTKVKLLKGSSTSGIPVGELSGTTQIMMFGMTYESS